MRSKEITVCVDDEGTQRTVGMRMDFNALANLDEATEELRRKIRREGGTEEEIEEALLGEGPAATLVSVYALHRSYHQRRGERPLDRGLLGSLIGLDLNAFVTALEDLMSTDEPAEGDTPTEPDPEGEAAG